jgi:GGDEF domain-containing protein
MQAATPLHELCRRFDRPVALVLFDLAYSCPPELEDPGMMDEALVTVVEQFREKFRLTDILGRIDHACVAAFLGDNSVRTITSAEGVQPVLDETLSLAVAVVHRPEPDTIEHLMADAELRLAEIRATQSTERLRP